MRGQPLTKKSRQVLVVLGRLPKKKPFKGRTMLVEQMQPRRFPWDRTPRERIYKEVRMPKADPGERFTKRGGQFSLNCMIKHVYRRDHNVMKHARLRLRIEHLVDFDETGLPNNRLAMFLKMEVKDCLEPIASKLDRFPEKILRKQARLLRRIWRDRGELATYFNTRRQYPTETSDHRRYKVGEAIRQHLVPVKNVLSRHKNPEVRKLGKKLARHYERYKLNSHEKRLQAFRENHPHTDAYSDVRQGPPPDPREFEILTGALALLGG